MVNENGMVECRSAGQGLRHAEHLRPLLPQFNGSTIRRFTPHRFITPQLHYSALGLGLVDYWTGFHGWKPLTLKLGFLTAGKTT
jgi:hypothetical protein